MLCPESPSRNALDDHRAFWIQGYGLKLGFLGEIVLGVRTFYYDFGRSSKKVMHMLKTGLFFSWGLCSLSRHSHNIQIYTSTINSDYFQIYKNINRFLVFFIWRQKFWHFVKSWNLKVFKVDHLKLKYYICNLMWSAIWPS